MQIEHYQDGVFTIHGFLSPIECQELIYQSEISDYHQASVQHPRHGPLLLEDIRNNDRVILEDASLADQLFEQAHKLLPATIDGATLSGFHHRFRFYRYQTGQYFKWHRDGHVDVDERQRSLLTFLIFLNDDFVGGETEFRWGKVHAQCGTAVVFPHRSVHQGACVESGIKYVLRTDVHYIKPTLSY